MKARILIVLAFALAFAAGLSAQTDNTYYAKNFSGTTVGAKVTNAMQACVSNTTVPCIIVLDPSLAAWPAGTMPSLCAQCSLMDWRSGPAWAGAAQTAKVIQLAGGVALPGTLQAALAAAGSNTTIIVPSSYSETLATQVNLSTNQVHVECTHGATLVSGGASHIFNVTGTAVSISGCGLSGATDQAIYVSAAASNVSIRDCQITQGGATGPTIPAGIEIEGANDVWIENNTFTADGPATGTAVGGDIVANYTNASGTASRLHILGNTISGGTVAQSIFLFNVSDSEVRGNTIDQNNQIGASNTASGYGIMIYSTSATPARPSRDIIAHNHISNTAGTGIYVQGTEYTVIDGNVLTNTAQQQLDTVLTVGAIGVASGYTSPAPEQSSGVVITGNVIHTTGKSGIDLTCTTSALIAGNSMDGVAKYGVNVRSTAGSCQNYSPAVSGNIIIAAMNGVLVQGTPGAIVKGNNISGFSSSGITIDSASSAALVEGNEVFGNTADGYGISLRGGNSIAAENYITGLTQTSSEIAMLVTGANQSVRGNYFSNSSIATEVSLSGATYSTAEGNLLVHTSGTSYAIQESGTSNVVKGNIITGGTASGVSASGTGTVAYNNSFGGSGGIQGNGAKVSLACSGTFTSGNLRSTDANGNDCDAAVAASAVPTKSGTPTTNAGVCWKSSTVLGTCTAGTWPNCSTCN